MTPAALHRARLLIERSEDLRLRVYDDANGKEITSGSYVIGVPTIGYGRALDHHNGLRKDEAVFLFDNDLAERLAGLEATYFWFAELDEVRQAAILDMSFPLGVAGIAKLRRFVAAIAEHEYAVAASYMLLTKFARDVKSRANRMAEMIRTGEWP